MNQEPKYREAYDYEPNRDHQGKALDDLHEYANTQVAREDSGVARCATFEAFEYACKVLSAIEKIPYAKVYTGLRYIGYNIRYHRMKNGDPDALWDMGEISNRCMITGDPGMVPFVSSSDGLFTDVHTINHRMTTQVIEIAKGDAATAGIKLSELNLFNALEGLTLLVENDQNYFLMRENLLIDESLSKFSFIKRHLTSKRATMVRMLGD